MPSSSSDVGHETGGRMQQTATENQDQGNAADCEGTGRVICTGPYEAGKYNKVCRK